MLTGDRLEESAERFWSEVAGEIDLAAASSIDGRSASSQLLIGL